MPPDDPNIRALITPQDTAAKVGLGVEQIGEFAVPGARMAKGVSKIRTYSAA